jgi:4-amino-4-deoxy-L-arabinose transferase-like glycosyltransferase
MPPLSRRVELLLLAAITAVATFLRLYRLDTLPPGDGHDVAMYGVDALQILAGARPIFLESNFGREPLFSYLVALAYRFTDPGAYGIHLVSAIVGSLTVPAVWLAARELFREQRATVLAYLPLLAALLSAVSYWHLNWSRVGLRVILVPLFAALIVFALWRGFASARPDRSRRPVRSWGWFVVAGVLLGLSLYTYQAARLLPVLVASAFVLRAIERRRWARDDTVAALLVAAAALVVFLPLGVYAAQHPGALSVRIQQATVVQPGLPLAQQVGGVARQAATALLTYSIRGDTDPQFTIPGRPSLNPFLSLGLLIGIVAALWRFRRSPYLFLLVWLLLMTAPAMVADQAATAKRYLGAFPAAMMLVAVGLLLPLERRRPPTADRRRPTADRGPTTNNQRPAPTSTRHPPPVRFWQRSAVGRRSSPMGGRPAGRPALHHRRHHPRLLRRLGGRPRPAGPLPGRLPGHRRGHWQAGRGTASVALPLPGRSPGHPASRRAAARSARLQRPLVPTL